MDTWRLIPMLLTSIAFSLLGKRFLNSLSAVFLGGIGGAFGTLDGLGGPYGGVAGLLVGVIIITIPWFHKHYRA